MKIGVIYPQTELQGDPEAVRRIGLAVEELGYDHLLVYDHVLGAHHDRDPKPNGPYTDKHPFHDPFVMLAYLAAITRRIELVTGVVILPQRQTALVARQAADVDLLSGERLRMGVGIGWNHVEYDALGQNFRTRGKRMDEQIGLLRAFWTQPVVDFTGRFDRIDQATLNPRPNRSIPLWLGGFSEPALRRAARVADGFIFVDGASNSDELLAALRGHLEAEGRAAQPFGLQCNMLTAKTPEAVVERAQRWRDAGGSHAAVVTMGAGFATIDEHVNHIDRVASALRVAGLLA